MSQPSVSVCIPVFNGADFITIAIDSVLNQRFQDFEIIIVDNHSTDNTVELIRQYHDPRIKLFENESNVGMVRNWNIALSYAEGQYIKILPADDLMYPDCLMLQVDILENDKEEKISLVSGGRHIINGKGKILFNRTFFKNHKILDGIEAINKVIRSGGNIIGEGGAVLFRKSILKRTGEMNSEIFYVFDLNHWFKILLYGKLHVLPDIVSAFRVSADSASVKIANKQREDYLNFIKKIYLNKEYQLTWYSYQVGLMKTFIFTEIKKLIYKFVVK